MAKYKVADGESVDFGVLRDPGNAQIIPAHKDDRKYRGRQEAGRELELEDNEALPLLQAGAIEPVDAPEGSPPDQPEEFGYQGEEVRNKALKEDEVYQPKRGRPKNQNK